MFTGPGAGPLLAAAAGWDGLAADLLSGAASFGSVTSDLTNGSWLGPSSAAMLTVATQYMGWLSVAAQQAEQVAGQVMVTVSAFEAALTAMVQPAVIAANRGLVQLLAATNWLGQNAPAIMDIESAYEQMWALDVAAMEGYRSDASAAAAPLATWQQILRSIGIDIGKNGQINLGWNNTGSGNIGIGNTGNNNVGSANAGNSNLGLGNLGNSNIGLGNTGNWAIGMGVTGDHQIGFGNISSATGGTNATIANPDTENTGAASTGSVNPSLGHPAVLHTDLSPADAQVGQTGADPRLLNASHYAAAGTLPTGSLSPNLLTSAVGPTTGLHPTPINPSVPSPAAAPVAASESNDLGLRSTARDSGTPASSASGIPKSNFYPAGSRASDHPRVGIKPQEPSE